MRYATALGSLLLGTLIVPSVAFASAINGTGATDVSTTVSGSMAGPSGADSAGTAGQSQREDGSGAAPAVASGFALSDLGGLPLMLVAPPQVFSMAPHGKLRGSLVSEDAVYGMTVGGGGGGVSGVSFQSSNPCAGCGSVSGGGSQQQVPEPTALLLAAPAVALAIRRRLRRRTA